MRFLVLLYFLLSKKCGISTIAAIATRSNKYQGRENIIVKPVIYYLLLSSLQKIQQPFEEHEGRERGGKIYGIIYHRVIVIVYLER